MVANHYQAFLSSMDLLYSLEQIDHALTQMADRINHDLANKNPLIIGVMNGAVVTMGHLLPKLTFMLEVDYCHATRYGEDTTGGDMTWLARPNTVLQNRCVLLIDDIFDEGVTLKSIVHYCKQQGATEVYSVVLLDKQHDRKVAHFTVDYAALTIQDRYVFGFGLDYQGLYRNAQGIYALPEE